MNKYEFWNVALASSILFFICFLSLLSNKTDIQQSAICVPIPFCDVYTVDGKEYINFSVNPINKYCLPLSWYIKILSNKLSAPILILLVLINPNFKARGETILNKYVNIFGVNMWVFWMFYFTGIALDSILTFEQFPWRYTLDMGILGIQILYVAHCFLLTLEKE